MFELMFSNIMDFDSELFALSVVGLLLEQKGKLRFEDALDLYALKKANEFEFV